MKKEIGLIFKKYLNISRIIFLIWAKVDLPQTNLLYFF